MSRVNGAKSTALGPVEFVALMATLTALVALSIDMILPALPSVGATLGVRHDNDVQFVVSLLFLGFGLGQFLYGPVSDSVGRSPPCTFGLAIFSAGCTLALTAQTFPVLLAGRVLQGLGVAGPRTMTIALVRDRFEGHVMARVMSFVMAVFILVPVIAPSLGQAVLGVGGMAKHLRPVPDARARRDGVVRVASGRDAAARAAPAVLGR